MERGERLAYAAILIDEGGKLLESLKKSVEVLKAHSDYSFIFMNRLETEGVYEEAKRIHAKTKRVLDEMAGIADQYEEFTAPFDIYLEVYGASVERLSILRKYLSDN